MPIGDPLLFVEINETNYIFVVGVRNDNNFLDISEKIIVPNVGISKNKFVNIDDASKEIKKNIELLEKKLNHVFKEVTVVIDNFDYSCTSISGFKKLNGSQILKENISYILNSLKLVMIENENQKTILHIFNSKSVLDGTNIENLPIGLFGDFYNHELTFFLINNNDFKNIKQVFNKINLDVKKVFLKSFSEGTQLIAKNNQETFFKIKINKDTSKISFFDQASFRYSENFQFGTNIIYNDISKICSLDNIFIEKIFSDLTFNNKDIQVDELIEEKYFINKNFRKIKKRLIIDIVRARIQEIINIILNKNINIKLFKKKDVKIFVIIQDRLIKDNFNEILKLCFYKDFINEANFINEFEIDELISNTDKLTTYGWRKEAIPITQIKNSLITRIFKGIFD